MNDEATMVLQMLSDGKVTAEQAAELLDALGTAGGAATNAGDSAPPRRTPVRAPGVHKLMEASMHGVDAGFVRQMGQSGYSNLSIDELIQFRTHGVDAHYIRSLAQMGITDLPAEDICQLATHGVTPEFIREMRDMGYRDLDAAEMARLHTHGVDAEFLAGFTQEPESQPPGDAVAR